MALICGLPDSTARIPREKSVMTAEILDGKRIAGEIRAEVAAEVRQFVERGRSEALSDRGSGG